MYQIRPLTSLKDIENVQAVEVQIWGNPPIPEHQIYTAIYNGGILLGAFNEERLIGFQYSFPGYKEGTVYLCSHMLGVLPDYRKTGLGKMLKEYQRKLAIEMGYELIVWTFDPLESINAYLNIHKLKGVTGSYLENHYGNLNDSLNKGLPTDRFLVEWWINSGHVRDKRDNCQDLTNSLLQTNIDEWDSPIITVSKSVKPVHDAYTVPIPEDFQLLKKRNPNLAMEWRLKTRVIFQQLLSKDYVAVDLIRKPEQAVSYYVFKRKNHVNL